MPKKHLGQNFLSDPSILIRIISAADLSSEDTIVEIGPGPGRMTRMLAERVKRLIAIELDHGLYQKLAGDFIAYRNVEIVHGDVLQFPFEALDVFKVVANIPYYITTPIIFRLLDAKQNLRSMTLTIQKEVAQRIVAAPGSKDYGVLSISTQFHTEPELKFIIPKEVFRPVPKVDSAVIHMTIRREPPVSVRDEKLLFSIIRMAFSQRRKTLSNSLKSFGQDIKSILSTAGIDPRRRPETLSIEDFARLSDLIHQ
jgi:16S rRNA (adenine1518-N6/adenine1519-N6)-dimethyltransferase